MGMNQTPASERVHISFFGRRNAGKSSLINAVTGQELAVVSDVKGTTTDPVYKTMELLPMGPVMLADTPGIDDEGELGSLRVKKSYQVLNKTDVAVLVVDGQEGMGPQEQELIGRFQDKGIPYLVALNKCDQGVEPVSDVDGRDKGGDAGALPSRPIHVSARTGAGIRELKEAIARLSVRTEPEARIVGDLVSQKDFVVLVAPIDKAAPKGRLILPQQQTIRDLLDADAVPLVVKEDGLGDALAHLGKKPRMVITDSQAFARVSGETPNDILLTSFSILFARYKGDLDQVVRGVAVLEDMRDDDRILVAEGCTHHRQCGDIGTVKIPGLIRRHTGRNLGFEFCSGTEFPEDLSPYRLVVHCGGCMLNEREMRYRLKCAAGQQVAATNYGILIAYVSGILKRSLEPFPEIAAFLCN